MRLPIGSLHTAVQDPGCPRSRAAAQRAVLPSARFLADDVRGHLLAGLSALRDDKTPGQLTALLKRALAQTERA